MRSQRHGKFIVKDTKAFTKRRTSSQEPPSSCSRGFPTSPPLYLGQAGFSQGSVFRGENASGGLPSGRWMATGCHLVAMKRHAVLPEPPNHRAHWDSKIEDPSPLCSRLEVKGPLNFQWQPG